jgi:formylglycine-generating enzyme required for sulfatase activity
MVPYSATIPGTDVTFEMIPVPGGEFLLGSPESESARSNDEGPQVRVQAPPFWIGKCEVTWAEYHAYMKMYTAFKQLQSLKLNRTTDESNDDEEIAEAWKLVESHAWQGNLADDWGVDVVTSPTPLYMPDTTYSAGDAPDQPAITMTQFAARQYTKWLSGVLGQEYRLPSEAEWEYAARAGTTTAYSFGDVADDLDRYGWYAENADAETHPVGTKEPNPWGLHDMHGNVAEWTLDEFAADRYAALAPGPQQAWAIVNWPQQLYPRVVRGGSWLDEAARCRSAARQASDDEEWKMSDPNLPLSPWWYTEEPAMGVGMRIVRGLEPLSAEDQARVWDIDVDDLRADVRDRLKEGRGVLGVTDPALPAALEAAEGLENQ